MAASQRILTAGYEYEFVSVVSDEYVCRICECPMRKPVQTKCGHRFCKGCLDAANKSKLVSECPMDRVQLNRKKKEIFQDKAAERIILSLIIKCPNKGCSWQGELGNFEDHRPKCDFHLIKCNDKRCDVMRPRFEMDNHAQQECVWREVACSHCEDRYLFFELKNHVKQCPKCPIKCPNKCSKEITREKIKDHISGECEMTIVPCSYYRFGCRFETQRKNMEKHMGRSLKEHLAMTTDCALLFQDTAKEDLSRLSKENKKLTEQVEDIQRQTDDQTDQFTMLSKNLQTLKNEKEKLISKVRELTSEVSKLENALKQNYKQLDFKIEARFQILFRNSLFLRNEITENNIEIRNQIHALEACCGFITLFLAVLVVVFVIYKILCMLF